jgi:uncharacterized RDD family membrane protein YckC
MVASSPLAGSYAIAAYASFWRRLGGLAVDAILLLPVPFVLSPLLSEGAATTIESVIGFSYCVVGISWGGTIGMRLISLRVVTADGARPGLGRALLRNVFSCVSLLVFGLGFLWMLWDAKRQTWHDKLAGTFVVTGE